MKQADFLTEKEVAKWIGVCERTLQEQRYRKTSPLPYLNVGGRVVYSRQAILEAFSHNILDKYYLEDNPLPESKTALEPVKRKPGRPRKQHPLDL